MRKPAKQALARMRAVHGLKHAQAGQALAAAAHNEAGRDAERRAVDEELDALCQFSTASLLQTPLNPAVASGVALEIGIRSTQASSATAAHAEAQEALVQQREGFSRLTAEERSLARLARRLQRDREKRAHERGLLSSESRGAT